jgi:hypothetical protein
MGTYLLVLSFLLPSYDDVKNWHIQYVSISSFFRRGFVRAHHYKRHHRNQGTSVTYVRVNLIFNTNAGFCSNYENML